MHCIEEPGWDFEQTELHIEDKHTWESTTYFSKLKYKVNIQNTSTRIVDILQKRMNLEDRVLSTQKCGDK